MTNTPQHRPPPEQDRDPRTTASTASTARNAWLTTAATATLAAIPPLYASHGILTSLLGVAGFASLAAALIAAFYAPRRAREIRASIITGRPLSSALRPMALVTTLITTTGVFTVAAVLAH